MTSFLPASAVLPQPDIIVSPTTNRVSSFQAKAALAAAGILSAVESIIEDPETPFKVKLAWQEGLDFSRDNPLLLLVTDQLDLTSAEIDDLFLAASLIDPYKL